jgi:hypothetical protein
MTNWASLYSIFSTIHNHPTITNSKPNRPVGLLYQSQTGVKSLNGGNLEPTPFNGETSETNGIYQRTPQLIPWTG